MPTLNQHLEESKALRLFIYGPPKSYKTYWTLQAAEAGYRVLYFDMDRGADIARLLSPAARERIYVIDCADTVSAPLACHFMSFLLRKNECYFNEKTKALSLFPHAGSIGINLNILGADTIILFDSYTTLVGSIVREYARANNIDLSDAKKSSWEGYRWCGALATWMLDQLKTIPCTTVTIGHDTVYDKYKAHPTDSNKQGILEWSKTQPLSSSNPHAMGITAKFTDVLRFYIEGRNPKIDTRGNRLEDAGGRNIDPNLYDMSKLSLASILQTCGKAASNLPAATWDFQPATQADIAAGGLQLGGASSTILKPIIVSQPTAASISLTPVILNLPNK